MNASNRNTRPIQEDRSSHSQAGGKRQQKHCRISALCALIVLLSGATEAPAAQTNAPPAPLETRGKEIVQEAFAMLSSNLSKALTEGGVSNALSYCSVKALPLTKLVADTNQVKIRRVTLRARNPENKADREETAILERYVSRGQGTKLAPTLRTNTDQSVTFFAPIVVNNPLCLNCHGEPGTEVKPEHLKLIQSLYRKDTATGYKLGDLRGMWRVDFAPDAAKNSR
jgi:hypothetical protein